MKLSVYEKRTYPLNDTKDLVILTKIKRLEKLKLNKADKDEFKLIRTQLKRDWRTPLINHLNKLLIKYKK